MQAVDNAGLSRYSVSDFIANCETELPTGHQERREREEEC